MLCSPGWGDSCLLGWGPPAQKKGPAPLSPSSCCSRTHDQTTGAQLASCSSATVKVHYQLPAQHILSLLAKGGQLPARERACPTGPATLLFFFFSLLLNRLPFCPFLFFFMLYFASNATHSLCTLNIRGMQHGRMHVCAYALYNSARNAAKPRRGSVCSGL